MQTPPFKMKKTLLLLTSALSFGLFGIVPVANSAMVNEDANYQDFRDFAENKGKFQIGSNHAILGNAPMPNFDFADKNMAILSLVSPQYAVSVAHNKDSHFGGYNNVYKNLIMPNNKTWSTPQFGGHNHNPDAHQYNYGIVSRNDQVEYFNHENENSDKKYIYDYNVPRFLKIVTEVQPIEVNQTGNWASAYIDKNRFPTFLRVGSGSQYTRKYLDENDLTIFQNTEKSKAYNYLIGGQTLENREVVKDRFDKLLQFSGKISDSAMSVYWTPGDSGSPIIAYDTQNKKWVLVGISNSYQFLDGNVNKTVILDKSFIEKQQEKNQKILDTVNNSNVVYRWSSNVSANNEIKDSVIVANNGQSSLILPIKHDNQDTKNWENKDSRIAVTQKQINENQTDESKVREKVAELRQYFNNGQDLVINGQGRNNSLELQHSINQGAGALYFNNDFTVTAKNSNDTWLGAGIYVAKDKTVNWQVKNPESDRLSKIGAGTLYVNGTGDNLGDISVGDGTVVLDQKNGKAFNQVGIVSGRGTVKLANSQQIDPNKLYFGYRGGRLDVNGNDLTFNYIQNVDEGAQIVNHHQSKEANIEVKGQTQLPLDDTKENYSRYLSSGQVYALRGNSDAPFSSTLDWIHLGASGTNERFIKHNEHINKNRRITAFNGILGETDESKFNGKLNITFNPSQNKNTQDYTWLLSGGSNLNGKLNVEAGSVVLSGRPTPYALNIQMTGEKKNILERKEEIFKDDDWISRNFKANSFNVVDNAKLYVGRNVANLNGDIHATGANAFAQLGFVNGQSPVCVRSDYHGETRCETNKTYSDDIMKYIPATQIVGNMYLNNGAHLQIGKANMLGFANAKDGHLSLTPDAHWTMTANSSLGNLTMDKGSQITLNHQQNQNKTFHDLNIYGNLTGNGQFNYLTDVSQNLTDKVVVHGTAEGQFGLYVNNKGTEPKFHDKNLILLSLLNENQAGKQISVQLTNKNQSVDLGAYRYTLKTKKDAGQHYYLFNPVLPPLETAKGTGVTHTLPKGELPPLETAKGTGVTHELPKGELPPLETAKGTGVTHALPKGELPPLETAKGTGVTHALPKGELPPLETAKGTGVTHALPKGELPPLETAKGTGVTHALPKGELPPLETAKGTGVTHELPKGELPPLETAKGTGVTHELPKGELPPLETAKGKGVTHTLPKGELPPLETAKGTGVTHTLPKGELPPLETAKGTGVTHALPKGELPPLETAKGTGVTHELPKGELPPLETAKGTGVTHELPKGELPPLETAKGTGVTHALPKGELPPLETAKGTGVTHTLPKGELPPLETAKGTGVTHELPKGELPPLETAKGTGVTHTLPKGELPPLETAKGTGVTHELPKGEENPLDTAENTNTVPAESQAQIISGYTNTALSDLSAQVRTIRTSTQAIGNRIRDIRPELTGIWAYTEYKKNHSSSNNYRNYEQRDHLIQLGIDKSNRLQWGHILAGAALSHVNSEHSFDDGFEGKGATTVFSVYGKAETESGIFAAGDIGYGRSNDKITAQNINGEANIRRNMAAMGLQIGKIWHLAGLEFKPTIGIRHYRLSSQRYMLDGAEIETPKLNLTTYETGLDIGKTFTTTNKVKWTPSLSMQYSVANHQKSLYVNGHKFNQEFDDVLQTRANLGIQSDKWLTSFNVGYAKGKEGGKQKSVGVGFSYAW